MNPTQAQAALLGAVIVALSPWRSDSASIVARVLVTVPGFLALDLSSSIVGTAARAVVESLPNAVPEGVLHGFGSWGLLLVWTAGNFAPVSLISAVITAMGRAVCRVIFRIPKSPLSASDGLDITGALRRVSLIMVVAGVWAWQVYLAFQYGKWWK